MKIRIITKSEEETFNLALKLANSCKGGEVFCLNGDLGVGKTVFSKGFANGLGIEEPITSPTFSIVNIYSGINYKLYHFDVYRIEDISELYEVGYYEYIEDNNICLIEWGSNIKEELPDDTIFINIKKDIEKGINYRIIEIETDKHEYIIN